MAIRPPAPQLIAINSDPLWSLQIFSYTHIYLVLHLPIGHKPSSAPIDCYNFWVTPAPLGCSFLQRCTKFYCLPNCHGLSSAQIDCDNFWDIPQPPLIFFFLIRISENKKSQWPCPLQCSDWLYNFWAIPKPPEFFFFHMDLHNFIFVPVIMLSPAPQLIVIIF